MRVTVDGQSRVINGAANASQVLAAVPKRIARIVAASTQGEKQNHRYTNRTGRAEASTNAVPTIEGAIAEMGVEYAQVLNKRGWSGFERQMANADGNILAMIDEVSEKL